MMKANIYIDHDLVQIDPAQVKDKFARPKDGVARLKTDSASCEDGFAPMKTDSASGKEGFAQAKESSALLRDKRVLHQVSSIKYPAFRIKHPASFNVHLLHRLTSVHPVNIPTISGFLKKFLTEQILNPISV